MNRQMAKVDEQAIDALEELLDECWRQVTKIEWQTEDDEAIAGRLLYVSLQHCLASICLLRQGLDASASALIRSCADCAARSLYALLCAGPEEIRRFKADKNSAFGRSFELMVEDVRMSLHARAYLPFTRHHVDGLFITAAEQYSSFSSYAHGGWQPVGWTATDDNGFMVSTFPVSIRSLSALVLGETITQTMMVHLVIRGFQDEAGQIIQLQNRHFSPMTQERIIEEFAEWKIAQR